MATPSSCPTHIHHGIHRPGGRRRSVILVQGPEHARTPGGPIGSDSQRASSTAESSASRSTRSSPALSRSTRQSMPIREPSTSRSDSEMAWFERTAAWACGVLWGKVAPSAVVWVRPTCGKDDAIGHNPHGTIRLWWQCAHMRRGGIADAPLVPFWGGGGWATAGCSAGVVRPATAAAGADACSG
jgi:hypothetical protein